MKSKFGNEVSKNALALVTFTGGLLGVLLLEKVKKIWWSPSIEIESWNEDSDLARSFPNKNVDYRVRVRNIGSALAENCEVKITLEHLDKEDVENCPFSDKDCRKIFGSSTPFVKDKEEFAKIQDEHLLWDIQPNGNRIMRLNISPGVSYLITIARFKKSGQYFEMPSENPENPRVWLKVRKEYQGKDCVLKEYKIKITVCGNNFYPASLRESLKANEYDPNGWTVSLWYDHMKVQKSANQWFYPEENNTS